MRTLFNTEESQTIVSYQTWFSLCIVTVANPQGQYVVMMPNIYVMHFYIEIFCFKSIA